MVGSHIGQGIQFWYFVIDKKYQNCILSNTKNQWIKINIVINWLKNARTQFTIV